MQKSIGNTHFTPNVSRSKYRPQKINSIIQEGVTKNKGTFTNEHQSSSPKVDLANDPPVLTDITTLGLGYTGYFIAHKVRHRVNRKGEILLSLIPIELRNTDLAEVTMPSPMLIDICQLIGNSDLFESKPKPHSSTTDWNSLNNNPLFNTIKHMYNIPPMYFCYPNPQQRGRRIGRLYFCSKTYHPSHPTAFERLKEYIEKKAALGRSPVVCIGGGDRNEKRFKCKRLYRESRTKHATKTRNSAGVHSCTLSFSVKWDDMGYYIPLITSGTKRYNNGCGWHSCIRN